MLYKKWAKSTVIFCLSKNQRVMNLKYAVGLDVSSKKIDACMSIIDEKQRVVVKSSTQLLIQEKVLKI